jgi:hypothetical protein
MRAWNGSGFWRCRAPVTQAGLLAIVTACATDEGASELQGEAILKVRVSAQASGIPVGGATIRLYADHRRSCTEQGPLTAELVTDDQGTLRIQGEGVSIAGGTCLSLGAVPPQGSGLLPAEWVPFVLEFRAQPPLDSVQVDVALEGEPVGSRTSQY